MVYCFFVSRKPKNEPAFKAISYACPGSRFADPVIFYSGQSSNGFAGAGCFLRIKFWRYAQSNGYALIAFLDMTTVRFLFSVVLIWVHTVITLLLTVFIVLLFFRYSGQNAANEAMELSFQTGLNPRMLVPVLIMLLLIMQLSYIINLFLGVVRRMN